MQREPPPFVWAVPDEKNILTCTSCLQTLPGQVVLTTVAVLRELHHRASLSCVSCAARQLGVCSYSCVI